MAYDNPSGIIAVSVVLELLAITCVGLRFYSRYKTNGLTIASDWIILVALVFGTGLTVLEIYGVARKSLAYPINQESEKLQEVNDRLGRAKRIELSFFCLNILALGAVKISASFLYRRIFDKRIFRFTIDIWIATMILWTVAFVLFVLFQCGSHLMALFGSPQDSLKYCEHALHGLYAGMGSAVASDFITVILPIPMIWSLQMPTAKKVGLVALFLIGLISVGAMVAKAYIFIASTKGTYNEDPILLITAISIWNLVEVHIGIVAACGPTLRHALIDLISNKKIVSLIHSLKSQLSRSSTGTSSSGNPASPSQSDGASKLPSFVKMLSGEGLKTQIEREYDLEMLVTKPDGIYVREGFAVERV